MYFQPNNYDALYRKNDKLIRNIETAMNGEYYAIHCYAKLALDINELNQILEIRQDEIK
ncbi:hypothetical protein [Bacillus nitratireducens]|uniref:Spo0E like sporulation regulatory protein n=1 Tax=Bacillus nitratireducens TaxID=2026193 RepID=A0ABU6PD52_9BACI|nr:hypothetical protein [Bacillus nitratireducens]EJS59391.1 hypothetical protein ICG_01431 [Bacillus cereus BAG1X1-3]EOO72459.1 hypothetical protein IC7_03420 [Bacillus cereus BAG1O-1]MED4678134.1 hypothetical protein [Bacillus nitratireducens]OSY00249.1 hypothetical protein BTJ45_02855 [Bacillus mycoides]